METYDGPITVCGSTILNKSCKQFAVKSCTIHILNIYIICSVSPDVLTVRELLQYGCRHVMMSVKLISVHQIVT